MGTVCFDDFPMLEFQATSASARECSENLLELLGWQFAEEGLKALPFDNVFTVFGINMDLPQSRAGRVASGNKPERVQSLLAAGSGLCTKGRVERGDAASLHGQLNFAQGQYIGSELKPVMSLVSSIATEGWHDPRKEELTIAAAYMLRVLAHAEWKLVDIGDELRPVLVFSDGAWEPGATKSDGAGLALIDPVAGARVVHHVVIPPKLLEFWTASGKKQVITELELWPVVVGVQNLASFLHRRKALWFIDNNAVKDMLVKGSVQFVCNDFRGAASRRAVMLWISRAPSKSNIAGYPSRGDNVTAAKLIDGVVGHDLQSSPDFVEVLLQSGSYDGYMQAKGDRPIV